MNVALRVLVVDDNRRMAKTLADIFRIRVIDPRLRTTARSLWRR